MVASKIALKKKKKINTSLDKINLFYNFCPWIITENVRLGIRIPFWK